MRGQTLRIVLMAWGITAVAVSAYALDSDYAKRAADTNPFYVGAGRSAEVSYTGGEAPHIEKAWDKGSVGYHRHAENRTATASYAGGEAPHTEKPWDKGSVGYHRHK